MHGNSLFCQPGQFGKGTVNKYHQERAHPLQGCVQEDPPSASGGRAALLVGVCLCPAFSLSGSVLFPLGSCICFAVPGRRTGSPPALRRDVRGVSQEYGVHAAKSAHSGQSAKQLKLSEPLILQNQGKAAAASARKRISGRYSKCIVSKKNHLPPQIKPCFSKASTT